MTKPTNIQKAQFKFFINIETRWSDMDCIGHINNATFLTYIETARVRLLENLGFSSVPIIMASIKIDYVNQLKYPSVIEIGQKICRLGNSSFDILTGIYNKESEDLITISTTTLVCYDYDSQNSIKVPDMIRDFALE